MRDEGAVLNMEWPNWGQMSLWQTLPVCWKWAAIPNITRYLAVEVQTIQKGIGKGCREATKTATVQLGADSLARLCSPKPGALEATIHEAQA